MDVVKIKNASLDYSSIRLKAGGFFLSNNSSIKRLKTTTTATINDSSIAPYPVNDLQYSHLQNLTLSDAEVTQDNPTDEFLDSFKNMDQTSFSNVSNSVNQNVPEYLNDNTDDVTNSMLQTTTINLELNNATPTITPYMSLNNYFSINTTLDESRSSNFTYEPLEQNDSDIAINELNIQIGNESIYSTIIPTINSNEGINYTLSNEESTSDYITTPITLIPSSEITNYDDYIDYEITTVNIPLVNHNLDTFLDPSKITPSTSFEISKLATVTRSATVTTNINDQYLNYDEILDYDTNTTKENEIITSTENIPTSTLDYEDDSTTYLDINDENNIQLKGDTYEIIDNRNNVMTIRPDLINNTTLNNSILVNSTQRISTEYQATTTRNSNENVSWDVENNLLFRNFSELERLENNSNSINDVNSTLLISLGVISSFVLIIILVILLLWILRKQKNHSKIYLSLEAARPRAFLTKPMSPACFPNEINVDIIVPAVTDGKPRPPVVLSENETTDIKQIVTKVLKHANSEDSGLDNLGFVEIPLEDEATTPNTSLGSHESQPKQPPKYEKTVYDTDSGIRLWSSSGSIYTASPKFSRCSVPPPDYVPPLGEEHDIVEEASQHWGSSSLRNTMCSTDGFSLDSNEKISLEIFTNKSKTTHIQSSIC